MTVAPTACFTPLHPQHLHKKSKGDSLCTICQKALCNQEQPLSLDPTRFRLLGHTTEKNPHVFHDLCLLTLFREKPTCPTCHLDATLNLEYAALAHNKAAVEFYLKDPFTSNEEIFEAWIKSLTQGDSDITALLLEKLKEDEESKGVAIQVIAKAGDIASIDQLLNSKEEFHYIDKKEAFEAAAKKGHFAFITHILDVLQDSPNCEHDPGIALIAIAQYGSFEMLEQLLDRYPVNNNDIENAIVGAARQGNLDMITLLSNKLASQGGSIQQETMDQAKIAALDSQCLNAFGYFKDHPMTPEGRKDALYLAVTYGHFDIVAHLLNEASVTPSMLGSLVTWTVQIRVLDYVKMIDCLLNQPSTSKVPISQKDLGEAVYFAVQNQLKIDVITRLLKIGDIDPNVKQQVYQLAVMNKKTDLVKLFE